MRLSISAYGSSSDSGPTRTKVPYLLTIGGTRAIVGRHQSLIDLPPAALWIVAIWELYPLGVNAVLRFLLRLASSSTTKGYR